MIKIIIIAVITYLATSIDEIPMLFMLYTKTSNRGKGKTITAFYFIGTFLLVGLGFLGAYGLVQIPVKWAVGLIGLVPLGMGIKMFIDGDDDEEKAMVSAGKRRTLWAQVLTITFTLGADDLGVYIPLFTTISGWEIIQMLIVYAFGTAILCMISYRLTKIERLKEFIEKRERFVVSIVYAAIGILVMLDCGTFAGIINLFHK